MADFIQQLRDLEKSAETLMRDETMKWFLEQLRNIILANEAHDKAKVATVIETLSGVKVPTPTTASVKSSVKPFVINVSGSPNQLMVGSMILYTYDPKLKKTLPYYDTFPLVFPISFDTDSFLGLNMHYLPPLERAKLFNALYSLLNNPKIDEKSKLNISYGVLKGAARFRSYRPCIKRYLFGHLRSTVVRINPIQWHKVLFLPIANFVKKSEQYVWQQSVDMLRKSHK